MKKNKKLISLTILFSMCLSFLLFPFTASASLTSKWNSPPFYPEKGAHPRVLINQADIPVIKANLTKPQNQNAYKKFQELLTQDTTGGFPDEKEAGKGNISANVQLLTAIEAKAFDYVINGNEQSGADAVASIKNAIKTIKYPTVGDYSRDSGMVLYVISIVYDWCYPLLSDKDKTQFIADGQTASANMEVGWPPERFGAVIGHGAEAQFLKELIAFAIATYDESPDIYEYVAGRFFDEYVPARNYWYKSHSLHQGSGYNTVRYAFDLWAQWLMYKISGQRVFVDDCQYVSYQCLYYTRPDEQIFREGDYSSESLGRIPSANSYAMRMGFLASGFYKDPYLKMELARLSDQYSKFENSFQWLTPVTFLIMNDPDLEPKSYKDLPNTKYFGEPNGLMMARTGWDLGVESPVAIAMMKIGGLWMANHNHLDNGTFQIYYKGNLANDSGLYTTYGVSHDVNWHKETIAHNGLLIYDPSEVPSGGAVNSGGQRRPGGEQVTIDGYLENDYKMAQVIGHEFGPDPYQPEYSYISGDITKSYTDKVSEVTRSMMFMPNENKDAPAVFFVMDKIAAKKANFKKTFLLHSLQEPEVDGNVTTIKRDTDGYNGKLTVQTLYPQNPTIEKIGGEGKQWYINGTNYVPSKGTAETMNKDLSSGWGRVEISPTEKQKTDYFLNAMYVSDADGKTEVIPAELIETDELLGAKLDQKVTMFNKEQKRIAGNTSFTVPGSGTYDIAVCGLEKGEWSILLNGKEIGTQIASEEGGMIYFSGEAGNYTLRMKDASKVKETPQVEPVEHENISIKIGKDYLYSDVPATIKDDRTLVPMRAIFEKFGAEVEWEDATQTATATRRGKTIRLTEGSQTVYVDDQPVTLDVPAQIVDGRFLVPVRFIAETFGSTVTWDDFAKIVNISEPKDMGASNKIPVVNVTWSSATADDKGGYNAVDGDLDTRWAANGIGENLTLEFDGVKKISSFSTAFNDPISRGYFFELEYSVDGKTFTKFFEGKSSQKQDIDTFKLDQPINAKYIRYIGKGGTYTDYILLQEIEFYE